MQFNTDWRRKTACLHSWVISLMPKTLANLPWSTFTEHRADVYSLLSKFSAHAIQNRNKILLLRFVQFWLKNYLKTYSHFRSEKTSYLAAYWYKNIQIALTFCPWAQTHIETYGWQPEGGGMINFFDALYKLKGEICEICSWLIQFRCAYMPLQRSSVKFSGPFLSGSSGEGVHGLFFQFWLLNR